MVAVLSVIAWVAVLGFLADLLSKPVLVGYMAGVPLLMIVGQLDKLTGVVRRRPAAIVRRQRRGRQSFPSRRAERAFTVMLAPANCASPQPPES